MILEQIIKEQLARPFIIMPGEKIKLVLSDGDKVRVVFSAVVREQRTVDAAVM